MGAVTVVLVLGALAEGQATRPERRVRTLQGKGRLQHEGRCPVVRPGNRPGQDVPGRRFPHLVRAVLLRARPGRDPDGIPPVAVLAERCAALARAGVPMRRAWELLSGALDPPGDPVLDGGPAIGAPADPRRGPGAGDEVRRVARQVLDMLDTGGDVAGGLLLAAETDGSLRGWDGHAHLRWLAAVWTVVDRTGAPLAEVLDEFARGLRQEHTHLLDRATALAGPRATARVLAALPAAGMGLGYLLGADPIATLCGTPAGRVLFLVGGAVWVVGRWWVSRRIHPGLR
jgi:tight adherence protein B